MGLIRTRRAVAVHGTRSCYTNGCRQPECTEANRVYVEQWRRRRGVQPLHFGGRRRREAAR